MREDSQGLFVSVLLYLYRTEHGVSITYVL